MQKRTYNASEIAEMLGISLSKAYELLHRADFPTLRIGRRLLVVCDRFEEWLAAQSDTAIAC